MMRATCSNNAPRENPLGHTKCWCSGGEKCECSNKMGRGGISNQLSGEHQGSEIKADVGLLTNFGSERVYGHFLSLLASSSSFRGSHQALKPTSQVSIKEHSGLLYQSDCTSTRNYSSPGLIGRRSSDLLSVATIRSITSCIANTTNLNLAHAINQNGRGANIPGSQSDEFNSGTCTTLILGSTPLRHISLFQSLFGLPNHVLQSIWPPHVSVDSTFRLGQATASSDDNRFQNETQNDLWRQLLMESTLYMHRPADSVLEGSTSFFVVTANRGVNLRLATEDTGVIYQQPLHISIEMRNRSGAMWLDVDNMSYEELLALEDHIGYVSTGLSEEAAVASLKRSNYFLFTEENAQKDFCSICQEDFVEEDELGTLDCGHGFHIACIEQWLGYKNVCPICKSPGLCTTRPSFSHIQRP